MKNSTREKVRNLALKYAVLDYILLQDNQNTADIYVELQNANDTSCTAFPVQDSLPNIFPYHDYITYPLGDVVSLIDNQANNYERFFSEGLSIIIDDVKG